MTAAASDLCDEKRFTDLLKSLEGGAKDDLEQTDGLLADHPNDGRLHFLRGSLLVGIGRPIEALSALRKAVDFAPDLAIARFQLGFFLLTSGDATEALSVWGPLAVLPDGDYLRLFVEGLTHLIRDDFGEAIAALRKGIAVNNDNHPLNRDMALIVEQVMLLQASIAEPADQKDFSAASLLLDQFAPRRRTHSGLS